MRLSVPMSRQRRGHPSGGETTMAPRRRCRGGSERPRLATRVPRDLRPEVVRRAARQPRPGNSRGPGRTLGRRRRPARPPGKRGGGFLGSAPRCRERLRARRRPRRKAPRRPSMPFPDLSGLRRAAPRCVEAFL